MKFECVIKSDCTNRKRAPTNSTRHYEHYIINHETILDVVKNSCERFRCLQHTWFSPGIVEFVKHLSTMETSCLKFDTNVSVHNFTRSVGSTTSSSFCRTSLWHFETCINTITLRITLRDEFQITRYNLKSLTVSHCFSLQ